MQDFAFALGHFLEWTFKILTTLGWLPVTAFTLIMAGGFFYWLMLQGRYNREAREKGSLA
jgi:hypothetical protein